MAVVALQTCTGAAQTPARQVRAMVTRTRMQTVQPAAAEIQFILAHPARSRTRTLA